MIIYPAIDIRGGRCVRLTEGRFDAETVFADDPAEMALKWMACGAEYLHLVDLDGALAGEGKNIPVITTPGYFSAISSNMEKCGFRRPATM